MNANGCNQTEDCTSKLLLHNEYSNEDIFEYIKQYIPNKMYFSKSGGLRFLSGEDIKNEINPEAWPGGIVVNYGFMPIARTIGGNLICISNNNGSIYFADHSYIDEDEICFHDETKTRLLSVPLSSENLHVHMPLLADSVNDMIEKLLEGENSPYALQIFKMG